MKSPKACRSGNSFLTAGDLINALDFTAQANDDEVPMGGKADGPGGRTMVPKIRFKSPKSNNNQDKPVVDHIDLIAGDITGKIPTYSPEYANATNPSTRVIKTFTSHDWKYDRDGYKVITYPIKLQRISNSTDLTKWRGVDSAFAVPIMLLAPWKSTSPTIIMTRPKSPSTATTALQNANAWADLWFYSNPIFVNAK